MANISYLSLSGETQGLISAGCSTLDSVGNKAQPEHKDQINGLCVNAFHLKKSKCQSS